jgi:hypothetical protein
LCPAQKGKKKVTFSTVRSEKKNFALQYNFAANNDYLGLQFFFGIALYATNLLPMKNQNRDPSSNVSFWGWMSGIFVSSGVNFSEKSLTMLFQGVLWR